MEDKRRGFTQNTDGSWPCQRLRIGWALVLFFVFELTIGQKLPLLIPILAFGSGLALLGSAGFAIRSWKMQAQIALIMDALDRRVA